MTKDPRYSRSLDRRDFLRLGAAGLAGLSLPICQAQAASGQKVRPGKARRCIILMNVGGPPHQDTFDLKPDAPSGIRGEFAPIATNVTGIQICEHLPRLARHADKFAIVRSMRTNTNDHSPSLYAVLSGFFDPNVRENTGFQVDPKDHPALGSVLWKLRGKPGPVPPFVLLCGTPLYNSGPLRGELGGRLGQRYNPLTITNQDYSSPTFRVSSLQLTKDVSPDRLLGRQGLLRSLDATSRVQSAWSAQQQSSFDLLASPRVQSAFDLTAEPSRVRDRYGRHPFGQAVLLSRRLLEQDVGVSIVLTHYTAPANEKHHLWDTHVANFAALKEALLPTTDQTFSALLEDLDARGLLEETLVVWLGEFGRTPKINGNAGRDHWGSCFSVVLAGGGIRGGQVFGSSDRNAAFPKDDPVTHGDLHATIYHALGVDSRNLTTTDSLGRELPLHDTGAPITKLFA